jgi:predicted house-cleaning noncanonical NTP pyrophosphatase (MazG superfamily)
MKYITFICNKLARDKTIETMQHDKIQTKYHILNPEELRIALPQKLLEEATEVANATYRAEIIAELADIFDVIDGLKKTHAITAQEIADFQAKKRNKRGGFERGVFLESITLAEESPWVKHFRASPDRYIEQS